MYIATKQLLMYTEQEFKNLNMQFSFLTHASVQQEEQQLTSRQETESCTHLGERSKQHHVSSNSKFNLHSPKALYHCFQQKRKQKI